MRSASKQTIHRLGAGAVMVCALWAPMHRALAQPGTVEEIITPGLNRMSRESFLQAFGIREGDPYDPDRIRSRFRELWDLGVFEDIRIEADDAPEGGKALIITVVERPILSAVSYGENKVLNQTQIEDRLVEREVQLKLGRPLSIRAIYDVEVTIRDFLGEKGYLDAKVSHVLEEETVTSKSVHFTIKPGGKTKIRSIQFIGNEIFSDRRLRKELELTKARKWYWPWSSKNLYHPVKWDQDVGGLRDLYQNAGYLDVEIRPPVVEVVSSEETKKKKKKNDGSDEASDAVPPKKVEKYVKKQKKLTELEDEYARLLDEAPPEGLTPREEEKWDEKHRARINKAAKDVEAARRDVEKAEAELEPAGKRWVALGVPVSEGPQYRAGELSVEGNTVFEEAQVLAMVPVREGMILSNGLVKIGIDRITRMYGDRGYLYANVVRRIRRHEDEPVADVQIAIQEDEPYFVESIEFQGNTSTQDRVLRREFQLNEGELFSRTKLDLSAQKVNQLGYVRLASEPIIEPQEDQNRVAITVPVEEQGRNEIQVGGGYSGVDGAFFTGLYSTRNFLGRGQNLAVSLQVGGRSSRYALSFVEPWFLGKPYTLGFSLFSRDVDFGGDLSSSGEGFGIVFGKRVGVFSTARVNYNWEKVSSSGFTTLGGDADNTIASITPAYSFNRINNPFRPTRGWSLQTTMQIAGGPLRGDTSFLRPIVSYTGYRRGFRRFYLGFHGEIGMVTEWAEGTTSNTATVDGVPRFERFWLGGDQRGPRIFETRTITPRRFINTCAQSDVDAGACSQSDLGQIIDIVDDPTGLPVEDFDQNGDGVLTESDLIELGGDRFFLLQAELVYPLNEQFDLAFFVDVGNSLFEDQSWGFDDYRASAGVEMRFHLPVFPAPLRLIYGVPIEELPQDRSSNFTFSIGRSF